MKKLLLMFATVATLFATSCVTDTTDSLLGAGEKCTVTLSVATDALGTRAINDGAEATKLMYAVYNNDQNNNWRYLFEGEATMSGLSATIPVQLVKNNTYSFVFWAQSPDATCYDVDFNTADGPTMTVDYNGAKANDDTRDAFFGKLEGYHVTGPISASVKLTRPFAQINFATKDTDKAEKAGFDVANATTTVTTEAYTKLNLATGNVVGDLSKVTFSAKAHPTEALKVKGSDIEWDWLAMNYILAHKDEMSLSVCEMTIATTGMESIKVEVPAAPARRNWRTNLVGSLLTQTGNIEVVVDKEFAGEIPNPEDDNLVHELILTAAVGGEITLTNDVVLTQTLNVTADMTINLNGKKIEGKWHKDNGAIIKNSGTLTIVGGTISSLGENGGSAIQNSGTMVVIDATLNGAVNANGSWPSYTVNNTGNLTLNDVVVTSYHGAVASYGDNAVVTLNDSAIDMQGIPGFTSHGIYTYNNGKVVVNGGNYTNHATDQNASGASVINGAVTVNNGNFSGRIENYYGTPVLKGGSYTVNPNSSFIAAGYKAIEKDGKYYVVAEDVDAVATTPAEVLSAMKVAGQTVCVAPTADGSAHKLEGKMSLAEGVSLIGMGDEPVALFNDWGSNAFANQAHFTNTTVENINFTNNLVIDAGIANGNVHFKNCVFGGNLAHQGVHFDSGNATIVFDNCTFVGRNMLGASLTKVIFNDCTFFNKKSSLTGADKWTGVNMWGKYEFNNCVFDTEATCNVKTDSVEATFTNCKYTDNRNIEEVVNNYAGYPATIIIDGELLPTPVSTTEQFANALSVGGNIALKENIAVEKIDLTNLTNDVVIDANGKTITTNSNYGIQVKAGKNITLKNAKVEITVDGNYITYAAGLKIENGDYLGNTITLKNCEIKMCNDDWAYAVNMPASVKNLTLVIDGCTLEGAIALQCWGDNNTITATNSHFICNYKTNAMYTSYCVVLQGDGTNKAENNTLNISGCEFSYSGVDNFNSVIKAVSDVSGAGNNTITVVDCTYNNKVTAY